MVDFRRKMAVLPFWTIPGGGLIGNVRWSS